MADNSVPNVYKSIPKKFIKKYHNPHYEDHKLNHPFRMVIVGASGAGKTQLVVHILSKMRNTFTNVHIYTKNKDEPIYQWLEEKIETGLIIKEGLDDVPSLQKDKNGVIKGFEKADEQSLIIFDDVVLEKDQSKIEQMFIRGRKIAGGISIMYLTQSYFKVPKTIRINCTYIILKKLASTRDLQLVLSDYNLGVTKDTLLELYKYCTRIKEDFMLLDLDAIPEERFRHNLLEVLTIENFNPKKPAPLNSQNEVKPIEDVKIEVVEPVEDPVKPVEEVNPVEPETKTGRRRYRNLKPEYEKELSRRFREVEPDFKQVQFDGDTEYRQTPLESKNEYKQLSLDTNNEFKKSKQKKNKSAPAETKNEYKQVSFDTKDKTVVHDVKYL
jgi:hypothetical protein